jgi:hypothetical protein
MKKLRETATGTSAIVPQWLHKIAMKPKLKNMVRMYLNWRRKNPGQGSQGVQQVIKMMGLSPRDGNLLIDTLNDMVKKGQMPKHLAIDEQAKYDYGTPESVKLMKKITPGEVNEEDYDRKRDRQAERGTRKVKSLPRTSYEKDPDSTRKAYAASMKNIKKVLNKESIKPTTAQIRLGRAAKKAGVGKNDEFYKSKMDPETRKKYEPKKRPEPMQVKKPVGSFKWFATRDMKKDG